MKLSDFDYNLPSELIATKPAEPRDHSRLLVLNKQNGEIIHRHFCDLPEYLQSGDILVVNNSKVFPARLLGHKAVTGGKVEIFLEREIEPGLWQAIGRNLEENLRVVFSGSHLEAIIENKHNDLYHVRFNLSGEALFAEFSKVGEVPLPPYIKHQRLVSGQEIIEDDKESYQTVYADQRGSVAAPTAGLHFTPELLEKVKAKGVEVLEITLHVGMGTYAPIKTDDISEHKMHEEYFSVKKEVLEKIITAKSENRRIIAVGTTTTRTLEHIFSMEEINNSKLKIKNSLSGSTSIFIKPGYQFECVDAIITNFHLPKSTLLLLVSAFASKAIVDHAYDEAIKQKYRFYSYGDAMFIV